MNEEHSRCWSSGNYYEYDPKRIPNQTDFYSTNHRVFSTILLRGSALYVVGKYTIKKKKN